MRISISRNWVSNGDCQRYIYRFFPFRICETSSRYIMLLIPADYPVEQLSGPPIVGYLLNWGLFGTLSVQLYLYYLAFPKDRNFIKSLVYSIYILELVQTILVAHDAFAVFGYGFGDWEVLTEIHFSWLIVPIIGAVAASVGHAFYAYRIFVLSRSQILPAFIICVSLTSFVSAIIAGVCAFEASDPAKFNDRETSISIGISCGSYVLCDVVIAICMTYYLTRSNTGFRPTQTLVTKLIRLTIETGSVTAIVALVTMILFLVFPQKTFYVTPSMILSKMYANTIYMVLNSRIRIIGGRDPYMSSTDTEITAGVTSHSTLHAQQMPLISITKEVFSSNDEMDRIGETTG
ncbi:hypothetical protein IW261DRAFT_795431 [Armillaria novae-zelandiae]|uniref:DUF6534 domain-containing protein n=1 Tax=Armillaria novae-zelandiae TaxID=153914 RepID=A0AA39PLA2_9AGAR|nr:hypothetical protein IW261DRAFT_795431 [Armillaria novae-zelandiae]